MPKPDYLLITSTTYDRDILNLLFLPEDLHYRFRYREQWVPSEIFSKPSVLRGKEALVVYFYGAVEGEVSQEFLPLRMVTIDQAELLGDIVYVKFRTGQLVSSRAPSTENKHPMSDLIKGRVQPFLSAKPPLEKYIISITGLEAPTDGDPVKNWTNIVHFFGRLPPFRTSDFLKLIGLYDERGSLVWSKEIIDKNRGSIRHFRQFLKPRRAVPVLGYALRGGRSYRFDILQRTRDDLNLLSPIELKLEVPDSIVPLGTAVIVGKYDKLEVNFATKSAFQDQFAVIVLRTSEGKAVIEPDETQVSVRSAEPRISVRVKRTPIRLPVLLIAAGVSLTAFSDQIVSGLSSIPAPFSISGFPLGILLKGLGPALAAVGIGILGRRL